MGMFDAMLGCGNYSAAAETIRQQPQMNHRLQALAQLLGQPYGSATEAGMYDQQRMSQQQQVMYQAMQEAARAAGERHSQSIDRLIVDVLKEHPRKVVESRVLSPTEVARRQITGTVQAVKDAQEGKNA